MGVVEKGGEVEDDGAVGLLKVIENIVLSGVWLGVVRGDGELGLDLLDVGVKLEELGVVVEV